MFQRRRTTLKQQQGPGSQRKTMKQRGGKMFAEEGKEQYYYIDEARADIWRAKIDSSDLKSIFKKIGLTDKDPLHRTSVEQDLVIEYQDELFDLALQIAAENTEVKLDKKQDLILNAGVNNKKKTEVINYILDVAKLVLSVESLPTEKSKITIFTDENDTLTRMFIFPARLRNIFIESLANILKTLNTFKEIIEKMTDEDSISILANYFEANLGSNMSLQTSLIFPRDGFFLGQPTAGLPTSTRKLSDFFKGLINHLKEFMKNESLPEVKELSDTTTKKPLWEKITALVYVYYEKKELEKLLTIVKALPVTDENNRQIRHFVLHLCHKLMTDTTGTE
jgi:hypothetical protein